MSCNTGLPAREPLRRIVSIPIGFSNELQPKQPAINATAKIVSIPIGFSNELQQASGLLAGYIVFVSIPIGFSNELQRPGEQLLDHARRSFNPYRVFQ